jgi:hypothetical protein
MLPCGLMAQALPPQLRGVLLQPLQQRLELLPRQAHLLGQGDPGPGRGGLLLHRQSAQPVSQFHKSLPLLRGERRQAQVVPGQRLAQEAGSAPLEPLQGRRRLLQHGQAKSVPHIQRRCPSQEVASGVIRGLLALQPFERADGLPQRRVGLRPRLLPLPGACQILGRLG